MVPLYLFGTAFAVTVMRAYTRKSESAVAIGRFFAKISAMQISNLPFGTTDWSQIEPTTHPGEAGFALWRTRNFGPIRVRMVEYSPGYMADHWCSKGHILLCLEGELITELQDGRKFTLTPGTSYQVADNAEAHRSITTTGAKLFIVD
jgi:hypothetical protein